MPTLCPEFEDIELWLREHLVYIKKPPPDLLGKQETGRKELPSIKVLALRNTKM